MGRRAAAHGDQQPQTQQSSGQNSFGVQTITSTDQDLDLYPVEQPPAAVPQPEQVPQRTPFAANSVGSTLVVSAPEGPSQGAAGLARALPADNGRTVVVVDFPGGDQSTFWPHVVTALHGRGPIRLAVSHAGTMRPTAPAQWLAEQLQAEVVAPDGVLTTVPGAAFVVGTQGYGSWVKFQPNASPMPYGRRFPVPQWEAMDPNSPWPTGEIGVSEPIPSGLWLRAQQPPFDPAAQDSRPIVALPCRDNVLTVVVGGPGQSSIPIDEVCRLLTALPQAARSRVRLVPYGIDAAIGSLVADQIGEPIAMFTGLPVGNLRGGGPAVIAVDPRGQQTWRPFVTEVLCVPDEAVPVVSGYRTPVQGLTEVSPGVFSLGDGVVLEVVPSGLWVREQDEPYNAAEVRTLPLDPEWARLTVGTPGRTTPGAVAVHGAALVERLEPEVRKLLRLVFCDSKVIAPPPPPSGSHAAAPSTAAHALSTREPADNGTGFFTAVTPVEPEQDRPAYASMGAGPAMATVTSHALADDPDEAAFPSDDPDSTPVRFRVDGPLPPQPLALWEAPPEDNGERETVAQDHSSSDAERDTVRRALGERYGVHAATVVRLLSQRPDAEEDPAAFEAMVTDLTALLACVSQDEEMVVETLRMGRLGRLRPYVACIVSGLNRLPVHSGVATVWGVSGPTGPRRYRSGDVLVEHGLLDAIANPSQRVDGVTEYLIWSVTGRRVEVSDRVAVATEERVVFAPGTPFRVLAVAEAEGDHPQQVLLQEVAGPAADQEIAGLRPSVLSQLERAAANLRVLPVSHQVTA
ncbi:hypothetical protein SAMN04488074_12257 [Lentzea albidocapillata subsp. violacea]|uniref:NAD(+)--protein-arginine ADP-ribosyltransferase n=1 Tax=Lentzea albidocapillata subsp. violacea TaxID=128104 RepID=A0A1G9TL07_9PSEU|nr:hypothetical protein [Lentzea albidocapillata]SDM48476.1 hypothetical protein SAMN04488074_12257 [Lentzea albidocapillata subsp. violacea]